MTNMMRLAEATEWRLRAKELQTCTSLKKNRLIVKLFDDYLGRQATLQDLSATAIRDLAVELKKSYQPGTVKEYVSKLLTLWRWCAEVRLTDRPAVTVEDLLKPIDYTPQRRRKRPTHPRRSQEELLDWMFDVESSPADLPK